MTIRNERPEDFRAVEELTKRAFHNVNFPGCDEHYLAHMLRGHADFVGEYPVPLLVNELKEGALSGKAWTYKESAAYEIDMNGFAEFDKDFPQFEKGYLPSQELFYIYSNSKLR